MENIIVIAILLAAIGAAVAYIVRAKKNGAGCIGCSSCGSCPYKKKEAKEDGSSCCGKESGCNCKDGKE